MTASSYRELALFNIATLKIITIDKQSYASEDWPWEIPIKHV